MNRFTEISAPRGLCILAVILFGTGLLFPCPGWGDPSGLSLSLYRIEQNSEYFMNQEIGLIGVIKNETEWPLNVSRGIREMEIEQFLIATDPLGVKHVVVQEGDDPEDMQPTASWGAWETVPADVLEPGYIRSVKIKDLRTLFPTMQEIPGEWKIQAVVTISRFLYTVTTVEGTSGVMDDRAWHGTLESNRLRIMVVPDYGARLRIRVEDLNKRDIKAQAHVPVRVYNIEQSRYKAENFTLPDAWKSLKPLASGETGMGGWVTLPTGASCLPQPDPGEIYIAVAQYDGQYKEVVFEEDTPGWDVKCSGRLEDYILFGDVIHEFSVFGLNSVWLRNNVRIESGDVGAQAECSPCIVPNFEVALDSGVWVEEGSTIKGDSIYLDTTASVWNVEYNELVGSGVVRGEETDFLAIPLWEGLIELWQTIKFTPGSENVIVDSQASRVLEPGNYKDITVGSHAELELISGTFHFRNLTLGSHASVVCSGATQIFVEEQILSGAAKSSYMGPDESSESSARDVVIYVKGTNQAVVLGQGSRIRANLLAGNGGFATGEGCILEGSFIARDITIGQKSIVKYDGVFSQSSDGSTGGSGSEITLTAVGRKTGANCFADLAWHGADGQHVDVYRNDDTPFTIPNTGTYTDTLGKKNTGEFTYQICEEETETCSNETIVTF